MNVNFLIRSVMRQVMNRGIRSGMNRAAGGGKRFEDMSMDEKRQANENRNQMQNTRRMFNLARRFMR